MQILESSHGYVMLEANVNGLAVFCKTHLQMRFASEGPVKSQQASWLYLAA